MLRSHILGWLKDRRRSLNWRRALNWAVSWDSSYHLMSVAAQFFNVPASCTPQDISAAEILLSLQSGCMHAVYPRVLHQVFCDGAGSRHQLHFCGHRLDQLCEHWKLFVAASIGGQLPHRHPELLVRTPECGRPELQT